MTRPGRAAAAASGPQGGVTPPPLPWEGGCQCGAVRLRVVAPPLTLYCCHCRECQRQSSSAFGMSMRLERGAVEVEWSSMAAHERDAGGPSAVVGHFCGRCGVRLIHARRGGPTVNLKAGSLDDTSWLRPVGHIWTRRAQPWVRFEADALLHDAQPPDYDALTAAWRGRILVAEGRA